MAKDKDESYASVDELIEAFHSRNGFSRDRMDKRSIEAFHEEAKAHLTNCAPNGVLALGAVSTVTWGSIL